MLRGCDQCNVVSVNGVPTHETNCPNSHIDPATGEGYLKECPRCYRNFRMRSREQKHCCKPGCY